MLNGHRIASSKLIVYAALAGILVVAPAQAGGPSNPGIAPPQSHPHGRSYAEWSALWWQWAYSMPVTASPLFDSADLSAGQSGRVWFLGGTLEANPDPDDPTVSIGEANRSGSIPAGTALFFPILNVEASVLEGNGSTPNELADTARYLMDHAIVMEASIDGQAVRHLRAYRTMSQPFVFGPLPEENVIEEVFGIPAPAGTTSLAVADGAYLFVHPLPPGEHTIHWGGAFVFTQAEDGFDFTLLLDVNYTITVTPRR
jgi:hypothetical protein